MSNKVFKRSDLRKSSSKPLKEIPQDLLKHVVGGEGGWAGGGGPKDPPAGSDGGGGD
jgi:hypothetical protein